MAASLVSSPTDYEFYDLWNKFELIATRLKEGVDSLKDASMCIKSYSEHLEERSKSMRVLAKTASASIREPSSALLRSWKVLLSHIPESSERISSASKFLFESAAPLLAHAKTIEKFLYSAPSEEKKLNKELQAAQYALDKAKGKEEKSKREFEILANQSANSDSSKLAKKVSAACRLSDDQDSKYRVAVNSYNTIRTSFISSMEALLKEAQLLESTRVDLIKDKFSILAESLNLLCTADSKDYDSLLQKFKEVSNTTEIKAFTAISADVVLSPSSQLSASSSSSQSPSGDLIGLQKRVPAAVYQPYTINLPTGLKRTGSSGSAANPLSPYASSNVPAPSAAVSHIQAVHGKNQTSSPRASSSSSLSTTKMYFRVVYDYESAAEDELDLKEGDVVEVINKPEDDDWWTGNLNGRQGLFPSNYVEEMDQQQQPVEEVPIAVKPQANPVPAPVPAPAPAAPVQAFSSSSLAEMLQKKKEQMKGVQSKADSDEEDESPRQMPKFEIKPVSSAASAPSASAPSVHIPPHSGSNHSGSAHFPLQRTSSGSSAASSSFGAQAKPPMAQASAPKQQQQQHRPSGPLPAPPASVSASQAPVQTPAANKVLSPQLKSRVVKGLHDYNGSDKTQLSFSSGDKIEVLKEGQDWWLGRNTRTKEEGYFPCSWTDAATLQS